MITDNLVYSLSIIERTFLSEYDSRDYIEMGYVPSHLHHICFELFKNSMRATIELHGSVEPPPIKILMTKGKDNVCIKISDQGPGLILSYRKIFEKF